MRTVESPIPLTPSIATAEKAVPTLSNISDLQPVSPATRTDSRVSATELKNSATIFKNNKTKLVTVGLPDGLDQVNAHSGPQICDSHTSYNAAGCNPCYNMVEDTEFLGEKVF